MPPVIADAAELIRVEKRGGSPVAATAPGAVVDDRIRFRVSSEDPDHFGDVVVQNGLEFPDTLPAVADHSHRLDAAIGDWQNVERGGRETFATLRLLPKGASRVADLVRAMHEGGYPLASSVYFDIHRSDIEPIGKSADGPKRYRKGRVREITLTQFPANPAAIAVARSMGFNDAELAALSRTEPARASPSRAFAVAGAAPRGFSMDTNLSVLLPAVSAEFDAAQAALATATASLATESTDANWQAVQRATGEVDKLFARLEQLRAAEAAAARRAAGMPAPASAAPTAISRAVANLAEPAAIGAPTILRRRTNTKDVAAGTRLAQITIACSVAKERRRGLDQVAQEMFGDVPEVIAIARTAVGAADTTTAGWAQELVRAETRAMLDEDLLPLSIWARLASAGMSLNFAGAPSIAIPQMNVGMTTGGAWVGEGGVIPLAKGAFGTKRLYRYKLAGIVPVTKELERSSSPDAVETMRRLLNRFISNLLDSSMIDNSAEVTGVRPAGLLLGVTPITGTAGGGYNALQKDLDLVNSAFIAANVGTKPVMLINAGKAFGLRTMQNALGQFVFPDGSNSVLGIPVIPSQFITAGTAIVVDAEEFASAIDNMEFDLSEQATLTMANADLVAPTQAGATAGGGAIGTKAGQVVPDGGIPVAGGTGASTVGYTAMSLWQTYSLGIRLVMPAAFGITRAGAVQQLTGITW